MPDSLSAFLRTLHIPGEEMGLFLQILRSGLEVTPTPQVCPLRTYLSEWIADEADLLRRLHREREGA